MKSLQYVFKKATSLKFLLFTLIYVIILIYLLINNPVNEFIDVTKYYSLGLVFICIFILFNLFLNEILVFFIFILSVLSIEIFLRNSENSYINRLNADYFLRQISPYTSFSGPKNGSEKYFLFDKDIYESTERLEFNDIGLRAQNEIRNEIVFFGSSTIFHGNPIENTLPKKVQNNLSGNFKNKNIYNAGVISYNSKQSLHQFVEYFLSENPEMIITYDGPNDVFNMLHYDPRPGYPFNFMSIEYALTNFRGGGINYRMRRVSSFKSRLNSLLSLSAVYNQILGTQTEAIIDMGGLRDSANWMQDDWKNDFINQYVESISNFCNISKGINSKYLAIFAPLKTYYDQKNNYYEFANEFRHIASDKIKELFRGSDTCKFLDVTDLFNENWNEAFWDEIHFKVTKEKDFNDDIALVISQFIDKNF